MNQAKRWIADRLAKFIRDGGNAVSPENFEARKAICLKCPLYGKVEPIPGVILDGCTKCGCPTETKAKMLTVESEIVAAVLNVAAHADHKVTTGEKIICPHPDGNKWAETDKKFQ